MTPSFPREPDSPGSRDPVALPDSMTELLKDGRQVLGLTRPQTLEQLNIAKLSRLFESRLIRAPQFDDDRRISSQLLHWMEPHQPEAMLAVGGDGTLNLLSQLVTRATLPTILIPAGTANDFARGLAESTWEKLIWQHVDVIEVQQADVADTTFINMLALGCGARHSRDVDQDTKAHWGSLAYLVQAWQTLGDLQGFPLSLICDQAEKHFFPDAVQLFAANGRTCGGGYSVVDSARFDDGYLDLIVIKQGTPLQTASFIQSYLAGTHLQHELCCHFRCRTAQLELEAPEATTLDGEPLQLQRATLNTLPARMTLAKLSPLHFGPESRDWDTPNAGIDWWPT